jgi:hypothetical protein
MALGIGCPEPYWALWAWLVDERYVHICVHSIPELTSSESGKRGPPYRLSGRLQEPLHVAKAVTDQPWQEKKGGDSPYRISSLRARRGLPI